MPTTDFRDCVCILLDCATEVFGEDTIFLPQSGGRFPIRAIFDEPFEQVDPDTERVIASNQLSLGVKLADFLNKIQKQDIFQVRNEDFRVIDVREDGQGGAQVFLHRRC